MKALTTYHIGETYRARLKNSSGDALITEEGTINPIRVASIIDEG